MHQLSGAQTAVGHIQLSLAGMCLDRLQIRPKRGAQKHALLFVRAPRAGVCLDWSFWLIGMVRVRYHVRLHSVLP
jgi:hypothetical protein